MLKRVQHDILCGERVFQQPAMSLSSWHYGQNLLTSLPMKYLLTFSSTHKVLKAEGALKKKGISFRLDPAPSVISAYCNIVITLNEETLGQAWKVLKDARLKPSAIFKKEGDGYARMEDT